MNSIRLVDRDLSEGKMTCAKAVPRTRDHFSLIPTGRATLLNPPTARPESLALVYCLLGYNTIDFFIRVDEEHSPQLQLGAMPGAGDRSCPGSVAIAARTCCSSITAPYVLLTRRVARTASKAQPVRSTRRSIIL